MNTSQCAVYQVKDTPEYRDVRFRSYEKLKSEGRTVQVENYQQVYIGRIQPGETPADIKLRLQKQRPKNFKGHSIGCSDVIVITDDGKTTAYYVNKDGFIIIPEFLTIKSSSDTRLSTDTTGYEIEGKKGTWLAQDYILMNEKKWFLMEHEEYGTRAAYVILSEEGAVVMNDCYNGFDEEARRNIQNFMQQQAEQAQKKQQEMQAQSQIRQQQSGETQKKKPELANWQKVMDNGEYLRSAEMAEEANYNMIDGLMNNTPKKKDKNAPRRSVLKRLRNHQKKIASQGKGQPQSEGIQKKKPELANWQKVMDNGEYLRSAEMAEEANYNMIDGLMNNTPKKKDKNAPRRSVLKRLRNHQKKIASQGKGQPQQQKVMEEELERKKK